MQDSSLFLCRRWNRVGVHSEQFDKGSNWAERKERKSRVCQIQLISFCRLNASRYTLLYRSLLTDANARDNRFLLHNSYYSLPLGPSCHTISLFPLSPLARSTFHKNNLYFYFFCLTNNVHDIFFLLIYVLLYVVS